MRIGNWGFELLMLHPNSQSLTVIQSPTLNPNPYSVLATAILTLDLNMTLRWFIKNCAGILAAAAARPSHRRQFTVNHLDDFPRDFIQIGPIFLDHHPNPNRGGVLI